MSRDTEYWRKRAAEERRRAHDCDEPVVARVHRELADLCERRAVKDEQAGGPDEESD